MSNRDVIVKFLEGSIPNGCLSKKVELDGEEKEILSINLPLEQGPSVAVLMVLDDCVNIHAKLFNNISRGKRSAVAEAVEAIDRRRKIASVKMFDDDVVVSAGINGSCPEDEIEFVFDILLDNFGRTINETYQTISKILFEGEEKGHDAGYSKRRPRTMSDLFDDEELEKKLS